MYSRNVCMHMCIQPFLVRHLLYLVIILQVVFLCGAFQVLAEAEKELAVREPKDGEMMAREDDRSEKLPEWVEALRPVAKMATNVGSRIRIKVKEALELGPPQWAKEQLEWSISKDVFKGNASGPTKVYLLESTGFRNFTFF